MKESLEFQRKFFGGTEKNFYVPVMDFAISSDASDDQRREFSILIRKYGAKVIEKVLKEIIVENNFYSEDELKKYE